jgi:hypothetical protein
MLLKKDKSNFLLKSSFHGLILCLILLSSISIANLSEVLPSPSAFATYFSSGWDYCFNGADDNFDGEIDELPCKDGKSGVIIFDHDHDGIIDPKDNCPHGTLINPSSRDPSQMDSDHDGIGDICDPKFEICDDGIDNDRDGFVDANDIACPFKEICNDGIDNDGNGLIDMQEGQCIPSFGSGTSPTPTPPPNFKPAPKGELKAPNFAVKPLPKGQIMAPPTK